MRAGAVPGQQRRRRWSTSALLIGLFSLDFGAFVGLNELWLRNGIDLAVYAAKAAIESIAALYAAFYVLVAMRYRKPPMPKVGSFEDSPRVALVYLCCDDLDLEALQSIARSSKHPRTTLVIHDDSSTLFVRELVEKVADELLTPEREVVLMRRPSREGGKAAALNNVVDRLDPSVEFIMICDSDSYLPEYDLTRSLLTHFDDPRVALVQARNDSRIKHADCRGYTTLSRAVDFYDAFVDFMAGLGWAPFLGHNALLRVDAVREVGGFTPGELADDIDFSVKLRLAGWESRYARDHGSGERHPESYASLRRRTMKWAFGCTRILTRWALAVAKSRRMGLPEKAAFFMTTSYYHLQILLLAYLSLFYLILPFTSALETRALLTSSSIILFFTFVPSVAYFASNRELRSWPRHALAWGLTYGSQDFATLRAIALALAGRRLAWTPTNAATTGEQTGGFALELAYGSLLLVVAGSQSLGLLLLPTTLLFAGKFLAAPFLQRAYFGGRAGVSCTA